MIQTNRKTILKRGQSPYRFLLLSKRHRRYKSFLTTKNIKMILNRNIRVLVQ